MLCLSCDDSDPITNDIRFKVDSLSIEIGESINLNNLVEEYYGSNTIIFASNDIYIADVYNDVVTGRSVGETELSVATIDNGITNVEDNISLIVVPKSLVKPTSIEYDEMVDLKVGNSKDLLNLYTVYPIDADYDIDVKVSNNCVEVKENKLTAVAEGKTTVTMSVIFDGDEIFVFDITVNVSNSVQEISLMAKVTNLDGSNVSNILDVSQYLISVNTDSYTLDINHFIFSDNIEVVSSLVNNREYEFVVRFLNAGEYTVDYNDNNYVGKCIIIVDAQYKFAELYRYIVLDDNGDMMAEDENGYHFAIGVDGYNNPYNKSATIIVSYDDILIDNAIFSLDNTEAYTLLGNKISVKNCGCANVVITVGEYTMNLKFVATKAIADSVTINYPSDVYYNEIKHLDIEIIADNAYNYIPDNAMIITTNGNVVIDGLSIEMLSYLPYINGYVIVGDNVIDFEIRVHRYRFSNIACIINGKEVDTIYVDSSPLKVELRYCVGENEIDLTTFDYFNVTVDCENFVLNTSNIKHYFYIVAIGSDEGTLTVRDEHNEVIFEIIIIAQKII